MGVQLPPGAPFLRFNMQAVKVYVSDNKPALTFDNTTMEIKDGILFVRDNKPEYSPMPIRAIFKTFLGAVLVETPDN